MRLKIEQHTCLDTTCVALVPNLLYRPRVKLWSQAPLREACRNPRAFAGDHQMRPFRDGADREFVTAGAERAAAAQPTNFLGLGSFSVVLGAMRGTRCARQPQSSNGR